MSAEQVRSKMRASTEKYREWLATEGKPVQISEVKKEEEKEKDSGDENNESDDNGDELKEWSFEYKSQLKPLQGDTLKLLSRNTNFLKENNNDLKDPQAVEYPEILVTDEYCWMFFTKTPRRDVHMGVFFFCIINLTMIDYTTR